MKKKYILITLLAFAVSSCKKSYIDLNPLDSPSPDTYYQTDTQLNLAIAGAYVPMRDMLVNDYFTSEMRSDNSHYQPIPVNRGTAIVYRENVSDWNNDANNDYVNAVYFHCYSVIARANTIIDRIPLSTQSSEEVRKSVDGQAKFLRAWCYFKLVRLFGGVPLSLHEVKKADDAFLPRSTATQVYDQIIKDANDAISELLPPAKFPQTGEATKGAATMLLADVDVTLKKYAEAETLLNTLPAMGYALNANYADAFSTINKNSKESIFEIQYVEGTTPGSQPSTFFFQFFPRTTNTTIVTGTPSTNTTGGGGWNSPSPDLIAAYEPGDKRLDATIGIVEGTYNASFYLTITANKSIVGYTQPTAPKVGVPYVKKYFHPPFVATNNTNDNWPIYRYSEALLLLAEAQNEQGKSPLVALNAVRARAFGDALHNITSTDQATLRGIILHERRVELAFENKRFHDLQRSPDGLAIMQAYAAKVRTTYKDWQTYQYLPDNAFDIQAYKFLFPIPYPERGLNPDLTQNPGYTF